jgi:hypothetical protein
MELSFQRTGTVVEAIVPATVPWNVPVQKVERYFRNVTDINMLLPESDGTITHYGWWL